MIFGKKLAREELGELRILERLIRTEELKLSLVKNNTAVVPQHQAYINQREAIIQLLRNERENFVARCAHRLGFTGPITLDLESGKVWSRKT